MGRPRARRVRASRKGIPGGVAQIAPPGLKIARGTWARRNSSKMAAAWARRHRLRGATGEHHHDAVRVVIRAHEGLGVGENQWERVRPAQGSGLDLGAGNGPYLMVIRQQPLDHRSALDALCTMHRNQHSTLPCVRRIFKDTGSGA